MGYIYKIKNKIDNKIYIGQTIQDLEDRWKDHLKKHSNCRYLKSAFKKYGVDNFEFQLVCITFDNCLDDMEIKYIEHYNCLVPNGYNLRLGGNSGKHNEETKRKISETLKNKYKTEEISRIRTQESINKLIITLRNKRNTKIVQYDIHGNRLKSFVGCREASEYIGISTSNIRKCCNGTIKTAKGFIWKYEPIV